MPKLQNTNNLNDKKQQARCCVLGCKFSTADGNCLHRFPHPHRSSERFNYWLKVINNPEFDTVSPDFIYNTKRICSKHFESKYRSCGNTRIQRNGVPSLFLNITETATKEAIYLPNLENVSPSKDDSTSQSSNTAKNSSQKSILLTKLVNAKDIDIIKPFSTRGPLRVYTKKTTTTNPKPPTEKEICPQLNKIRDLYSCKTEDNNIQLQVSHAACNIIGISLRQS